ncbi:MAG: hypothetical protein RIC84_07745 [Aggregatilineales bacterium]
MDTPLPSNDLLEDFSNAIPWQTIEDKKEKFNAALKQAQHDEDEFTVEKFSEIIDAPIITSYDLSKPKSANVILAEINGKKFVLGSLVSERYRSGKSFIKSIVSYNLNPSVNQSNIHETDTPATRIRAMGAELELGLLKPDGEGPSEQEMESYMRAYEVHARHLGIPPNVDREACQYQVEAHVAPGIGYHRTRQSLDGIMKALVASSEETGLITAMMSAYPVESDFKLTDNPKVHTAVDLMVEVNHLFPEYDERLKDVIARYNMTDSTNIVEAFRLQGCHIHLDLAGRSEALGLLTFYTMLRSASALANSAVLKGGPFVNGTCDHELLCTREYLRRATVTGRYFETPLSPHLQENGLERFGQLMLDERVNAVARAMLYEDGLGVPISSMHNPIGRVRPDLAMSKRICTVESTGMPVNISASRQAAVLTDFEFSHALVESYFRKYGCDLEPMMEDRALWSIIGPLDTADFVRQQDISDRIGSEMVVKTATGDKMALAEFYEMKRLYMHRNLSDIAHIIPRDIDDVYYSLQRMLQPPSGKQAQTVEQYINDYQLRSTGNWGKILLNTFAEEGGVPGTHNPDAVLRVVHRIHNAMRERYLEN